MSDEKLLERARNAWEENGHFPDLGKSITGLFDRFEQMIADKEPTSIVWEPKDGEGYFYDDRKFLNDIDRGDYDASKGYPHKEGESPAYDMGYGFRYMIEQM